MSQRDEQLRVVVSVIEQDHYEAAQKLDRIPSMSEWIRATLNERAIKVMRAHGMHVHLDSNSYKNRARKKREILGSSKPKTNQEKDAEYRKRGSLLFPPD